MPSGGEPVPRGRIPTPSTCMSVQPHHVHALRPRYVMKSENTRTSPLRRRRVYRDRDTYRSRRSRTRIFGTGDMRGHSCSASRASRPPAIVPQPRIRLAQVIRFRCRFDDGRGVPLCLLSTRNCSSSSGESVGPSDLRSCVQGMQRGRSGCSNPKRSDSQVRTVFGTRRPAQCKASVQNRFFERQ